MITRTVRVQEAAEFVEVLRLSLPAELAPFTIYGGHGVVELVRKQAEESDCDSRYFCTLDGARIVAASEFRMVPNGLFLNYIATRPEARGAGHGTQLMKTALSALAPDSAGQIGLDVFADNAAARAWYKRLGFTVMTETVWLTRATSANGPCYAVSGLAQADVVHNKFGFSQLALITPRGTVGLGRLGAGCFRVTSRADFEDERLVATCQALDPARVLLGILPAEEQSNADATSELARSLRLTLGIDGLCRALA